MSCRCCPIISSLLCIFFKRCVLLESRVSNSKWLLSFDEFLLKICKQLDFLVKSKSVVSKLGMWLLWIDKFSFQIVWPRAKGEKHRDFRITTKKCTLAPKVSKLLRSVLHILNFRCFNKKNLLILNTHFRQFLCTRAGGVSSKMCENLRGTFFIWHAKYMLQSKPQQPLHKTGNCDAIFLKVLKNGGYY